MAFDATEISHTASVASLAIELLRGSLENLPNDHEAATRLITKACSVLESASRSGQASSPAPNGLAPWQIRKVKAHIDANIDKPLTVSDLSTLARLCPSHFHRAFKRSFGIAPHAYLVAQRIHRAQTLLLTTDAPLAEIALATGFADQSHFTTRFGRTAGATPGVWRRQRRECGDAARPAASFQ